MKRIIIIVMALMPLMLAAQARIAIVNSQQLFELMPEKAAAEAQLKELSDRYHAEYEMLQAEFDKKYADYQTVAADPNTPETIRERRVRELQEGDKKMREFERRAADDIAAHREALTRPIADRVQAAIRAAGLSTSHSAVHWLTPSQEGAYADMKQLLASGEKPVSCYFADNDLIAIGAMEALREAGYRIPEDVAIIGFDDIPACEYTTTPLTTISVPKQYMGEVAVHGICRLIQRPSAFPLDIQVFTKLIRRKSV